MHHLRQHTTHTVVRLNTLTSPTPTMPLTNNAACAAAAQINTQTRLQQHMLQGSKVRVQEPFEVKEPKPLDPQP